MVQHHHRRHVWLAAAVWLAPALVTAEQPASLTSTPGDAGRGVRLVIDAEKGNCVICHAIPGDAIPEDAAGDIGPPLDGVGGRLNAAQLRQRVVDPQAMTPGTIMPGYHVTEDLHRVQRRYAGRPILTAQEIEDVVAYLQTLR